MAGFSDEEGFESPPMSPGASDQEDEDGPSSPSTKKKRMTARQLQMSSSPRSRGKKEKGVIKTQTKGPKAASRAKTSKQCFAFDCSNVCKNKRKWCQHHFNCDSCLHGQAKKTGNMDAYKQAMADPRTARKAFDDWDAESPPGVRQKTLVEWGAWKKRYGITVAMTQRQGEELMSLAEFVSLKKLKGYTQEHAEEEWETMIASGAEGEGDGKQRKLWIAENKKRFRDRTVYEDAGYDEGGKAKKGFNPEEREKLRNWAVETASFGSKFMVKASADAAKASTDAPEVQAAAVSEADEINVALAAPSMHKTLSRDIKLMKKAFTMRL